jgi:hypothetical protein
MTIHEMRASNACISIRESLFEGIEMTDRVEWEVVDERSPHSRPHTQPDYETGTRPTIQQLMKNLLGRWWRWKIALAATAAALAVVFFATLIGIVMLVSVAIGLTAFSIAKFRRWVRRSNQSFPVKAEGRDRN